MGKPNPTKKVGQSASSEQETAASSKDRAESGSDARMDAALARLREAGIDTINEQVRHVAGAALAIFRQLEWEDTKQPQRGQHFPFAFKIGESILRRLDSRVKEMLTAGAPLGGSDVQLTSEVRFPDLSTERFYGIDDLLEKAGDKKDPERLRITWQQFTQEPVGNRMRIEVVFTTEKPLKTQELALLEFPLASMDLAVQGPDSQWVESTFDHLVPFFETSRIRGIYRPLLLFRNRLVVHIASWSIGFIGWILYHEAIRNMRRAEAGPVRQDFVDRVKSQQSIEEKFDVYVDHLYGPSEANSLYETLFVLAGGLIIYLTVFAFSMLLLPKLVPRSGINIGLAKSRYDQWENGFRLVVFSVLLSGILIPLIRHLFF